MSALSRGSVVLAPMLITKERPSLVKAILPSSNSVARSTVDASSSGGGSGRPIAARARPVMRRMRLGRGEMIRANSGASARLSSWATCRAREKLLSRSTWVRMATESVAVVTLLSETEGSPTLSRVPTSTAAVDT